MTKFKGIVDSYAYYRPLNDADREMPTIPAFSAVLPDDTVWCGVDERSDEELLRWSPSVCTSDVVEADDEEAAAALLLERYQYVWPEIVGGWTLQRFTHDVVMDEDPEFD